MNTWDGAPLTVTRPLDPDLASIVETGLDHEPYPFPVTAVDGV
jgi:hypothetical protein